MIGVVGCGYVGLGTAATLAHAGHDVTAVEVDPERRARLLSGALPFREPGLLALVEAGRSRGRLRIVGDLDALGGCRIAMIAVPTAPDGDDPTEHVAIELSRRYPDALLVLRGTLLPERAAALAARVAPVEVVANPEFLRAGHVVEDLRAPARLVVGGSAAGVDTVVAVWERLYGGAIPVVRTDLASACLGKLAANAMLALRVGFANELASVAAAAGASARDVVDIVGLDPRIGPSHLHPSLGFGGPCLPKDARMLADRSALVAASLRANDARLDGVVDALERRLEGLVGRRVALWGLAFKPGVDDRRDSPAARLAERLVERGALPVVHDPALRPGDPTAVVAGAHALVVATPWPEYAEVDPASLSPALPLLVDPSGLVTARFRAAGWECWP